MKNPVYASVDWMPISKAGVQVESTMPCFVITVLVKHQAVGHLFIEPNGPTYSDISLQLQIPALFDFFNGQRLYSGFNPSQ